MAADEKIRKPVSIEAGKMVRSRTAARIAGSVAGCALKQTSDPASKGATARRALREDGSLPLCHI